MTWNREQYLAEVLEPARKAGNVPPPDLYARYGLPAGLSDQAAFTRQVTDVVAFWRELKGRRMYARLADTLLTAHAELEKAGRLTLRSLADRHADARREQLDRLARLAEAEAGAATHVGPGTLARLRSALDGAGHSHLPVLAYSAKYASAFYGPFRDAAECAPQFGDRSAYQQDAARSADEGVREALLDVAEGADIVMVKPALAYLDVVRRVRDAVDVPVAAYNISGEYAMVDAAAAHGWIDRRGAVLESLLAIRRAGADAVLSYWAVEAAGWLRDGARS